MEDDEEFAVQSPPQVKVSERPAGNGCSEKAERLPFHEQSLNFR